MAQKISALSVDGKLDKTEELSGERKLIRYKFQHDGKDYIAWITQDKDQKPIYVGVQLAANKAYVALFFGLMDLQSLALPLKRGSDFYCCELPLLYGANSSAKPMMREPLIMERGDQTGRTNCKVRATSLISSLPC